MALVPLNLAHHFKVANSFLASNHSSKYFHKLILQRKCKKSFIVLVPDGVRHSIRNFGFVFRTESDAFYVFLEQLDPCRDKPVQRNSVRRRRKGFAVLGANVRNLFCLINQF